MTPRRITTLQWLRAEAATALGIEPAHPGADPDWAQQLRTMRDTDTQDAVTRARGRATVPQPRPALTTVPYQLITVPHLGELPIGPLEPAYLAGETKAGAEQ